MNITKMGYHHTHDTSFHIDRPLGSGDWLLLLVFTPSRLVLAGTEHTTSEPYFETRSTGFSRYRGYERQRKLQAGWNRGILTLYPTPDHFRGGIVFLPPQKQGGKNHERRKHLHL